MATAPGPTPPSNSTALTPAPTPLSPDAVCGGLKCMPYFECLASGGFCRGNCSLGCCCEPGQSKGPTCRAGQCMSPYDCEASGGMCGDPCELGCCCVPKPI
ncbi:MAG: hypothetical protein RXR01_04635 [Thermoproteus sp.]